jgi:hypothetical protein
MTRPLALILFLAAVAFAAAPFVTPPFTGYAPGQFPVGIARPAIQPAGYAFAIWSVIYFWLIVHSSFGLWKRQDDLAWVRVRPALTVALVLGTVWLAIAGTSPIWATVVILVMAAATILAFLQAPTEPDRWLLSAPLAIFAGWLTAAALVSCGILLAGYGYTGNAEAALDMLAVVLILTPLVQSRKPRMPVYSLTVIWALAGIAVANWPENSLVAGAAAGGGMLLLLLAVFVIRKA